MRCGGRWLARLHAFHTARHQRTTTHLVSLNSCRAKSAQRVAAAAAASSSTPRHRLCPGRSESESDGVRVCMNGLFDWSIVHCDCALSERVPEAKEQCDSTTLACSQTPLQTTPSR